MLKNKYVKRIYLSGRWSYKEGETGRGRERSSICRSTHQMDTMSGTGSDQSQDLELHPSLPHGWQGLKNLGCLLLSQMHCQRAGWEVQQLRHKQWPYGMPASVATDYPNASQHWLQQMNLGKQVQMPGKHQIKCQG